LPGSGSRTHKSFSRRSGCRYFESGGEQFTPEVSKAFALVNTWGVEMRYMAGLVKRGEAEVFVRAAEQILRWADGRM
jgi:hypothetical protein